MSSKYEYYDDHELRQAWEEEIRKRRRKRKFTNALLWVLRVVLFPVILLIRLFQWTYKI